MHRLRIPAAVMTLALVASACGGSDEITAESCDDIVDETVALIQRLIDDLDAEHADMSFEEFIITTGEAPLFDRFKEDAATIDELASTLACSEGQIVEGVVGQVGRLTSESELGRFVIDAIVSGTF